MLGCYGVFTTLKHSRIVHEEICRRAPYHFFTVPLVGSAAIIVVMNCVPVAKNCAASRAFGYGGGRRGGGGASSPSPTCYTISVDDPLAHLKQN
jgi:hypothetical protein